MEAQQLSAGGQLLCPFLRPNFVTQKQYDNLVKTGEALISAVNRMLRQALHPRNCFPSCSCFPPKRCWPQSIPDTKCPRYPPNSVLQIQNGYLHVMQYNCRTLCRGRIRRRGSPISSMTHHL